MDQTDLLRRAVAVLDELAIPYMIVGSVASAAYGEPRMTQDIDIVIDPTVEQAARFCDRFAADPYYVSPQAATDAVRHKDRFNVIDSRSGHKLDLMVCRGTTWARTELSRRQRVRILPDLDGFAARPEDVILGKLVYFQEGGSEKHLRDIAGMMRVSADQVDIAYIKRWIGPLGLTAAWHAVLARLGASDSPGR